MVDIETLIKQINSRMSAEEAYYLNKKVWQMLTSNDVSEEAKVKIKEEAMLEPLHMLAKCYENLQS